MADLPPYTETSLDVIDEAYDRLQATFASHRTQEAAYRLYNLKQLAFLINDNEERIIAAAQADLGKSSFEARLAEVIPTLNEIDLAVKRLPEWMKDDKRTRDSTYAFKLARPRVKKQPKGVALIIGAWNYPFQLTLSPLVGAIAAGCPAVIKMSEHAPVSAALIAELIPRYLDPEGYAVVNGAVAASTALLEKRWGHICYTGGGPVGKIVAGAAAKTLTPTTLELGGKSPTIVAPDADLKITARRMLSIKQMNVGQMCVSPDYVLVTKENVDAFTEELIKTLEHFHPPNSERSFLNESASTFVRNTNDYQRLENVLDDAEKGGKVVYRGEADKDRNRMGLSLVRLARDAKDEESWLVRDEIFGPILVIIPVEDIDAAIKYINAGPTPLALYVSSASRATFEKVVSQTLSGSAIWNDFAMTPICRTVPFGGVGESGWGNYHGYDGFLAFSHQRSLLEVPYWMEFAQKNRYAPNMNPRNERMLKRVMGTGINFSRPVSVESERLALQRSRNRRHLYLGIIIVTLGAWLGFGARSIGKVLGTLKAKLRL